MEQKVFAFVLIIEGDAEKLLQFIMQLKSIYHKNLGFFKQTMYFEVLTRKSQLIDVIFSVKKI